MINQMVKSYIPDSNSCAMAPWLQLWTLSQENPDSNHVESFAIFFIYQTLHSGGYFVGYE